MEHFTNCHGEWSLLLALLSLPPVGLIAWIKLKLGRDNDEGEE